ncbi:MAG: type II toxin-antitoxin system RelB/DinJ family antitoxin [Gemmatimonadetes bacterium]|nr:type II toxin-antitoxin system RelB/DinJ family antitoxin [Gemmatimonadota bacterium]
MSKSAMIRARVEPRLKEQAEATLDELGLSPTTAITLFYRQIVQHRGLPFELRIPNAATRRAMLDARTGCGVVRAESVDELFAKLDSDDDQKPRRSKRKVRSGR